MTTIRNQYIGFTHPIGDMKLEEKEIDIILRAWKKSNCPQGHHLWDEVWSAEAHYLHCDACGIEVHIKEVIIPDGQNIEINNSNKGTMS